MDAVDVTGLTRRFDGTIAVDALSFSVRRGEVFGLLGHNGAGKTTTIRLINGILSADEGYVRVLGMDPAERGPEVRAVTGVLTETPALDEHLTVSENLETYAAINELDPGWIGTRVDDLLVELELDGLADARAGTLSTGLKQRVALARALLHDPQLLLLDEPTSSLDPLAARGVRDLVASLSRERQRSVILCTHNLAEAQELCDRVAILQHGRLLAMGTPSELASGVSSAATVVIEIDRSVDDDVLATLRGLDGVRRLVASDGTLHVTRSDRTVVPELVRTLVGRDYSVYSVVDTVASLEQVYIELHRREVVTSTDDA